MKWNKIQFGAKPNHVKIWCQRFLRKSRKGGTLLHSRAEMFTTTEEEEHHLQTPPCGVQKHPNTEQHVRLQDWKTRAQLKNKSSALFPTSALRMILIGAVPTWHFASGSPVCCKRFIYIRDRRVKSQHAVVSSHRASIRCCLREWCQLRNTSALHSTIKMLLIF